jgi:uncharacterized membrane protein
MSLPVQAAAWLASTPVALAMRSSAWLYPIVEIIHILGFAVLVGGVALFDLRVLGFARAIPIKALGRHLLAWAVASLALVVPTGVLLFAASAQELIENRVFLLKLALIGVAGVNALLFHADAYRGAGTWTVIPASARLHAALSLALWVAVVSCGRLLAYV